MYDLGYKLYYFFCVDNVNALVLNKVRKPNKIQESSATKVDFLKNV